MATALDFPQATHFARGQPDRRRGLFFGGAGLARKISRLNVKQVTENPGKLRLG
jgi:hypothetical protein